MTITVMLRSREVHCSTANGIVIPTALPLNFGKELERMDCLGLERLEIELEY